jgi:hypothetical protein
MQADLVVADHELSVGQQRFFEKAMRRTVRIPYARGELVRLFRERGTIEREAWDTAGTMLA